MMTAILALALQSATPAASPAPADAPAAAPQVEPPGAATAAAEQWLALVDAGRYAQSWQASGTIFRARVTQEQWTQQLPDVRTPLGAVVSRRPAGEELDHSLPGAPGADYRVIEFDTDFAARKDLVETVVAVDEEGSWRVVGYFIASGSGDSTGTSAPPSTRR